MAALSHKRPKAAAVIIGSILTRRNIGGFCAIYVDIPTGPGAMNAMAWFEDQVLEEYFDLRNMYACWNRPAPGKTGESWVVPDPEGYVSSEDEFMNPHASDDIEYSNEVPSQTFRQ